MENTNPTQYLASAYVRLSKEDMNSASGLRSESNSISNQKQLILDFLKDKADIKLVSIREDDGYTGTDYDRPDFQRMMDDIRAGVVNCVIVKDLSRFGREYINAGKYIDRLFPYYGVRLISINDGIDTVTRSSSDDLSIMLKNLMNDNYCRDISIKIRSQLQVKRKNGDFIGAFAPYGYEKDPDKKNHLVIDPYAAGVVRDIFRWKLEGINQDRISQKLNAQGILSPMEYKRSQGLSYQTSFKTRSQAQWTPSAVRRILANPVYVGTLVQGVHSRPNYKIKKLVLNEKEKWVIYSDCSCAVIHEPIEDMQKQVLKVVNMMARILVERVAEIKADNAQEMPSVEKKIAEAQTHLQRLQAGKLDLYEDYRQGKITRYKFISIQKSRQQEADRLHSSLALLKGRLELLRKKAERMDRLVSDAKAIQMLPDYRPDVIRRLVQCVRVYGAGRIEIDLLENDDDLVGILESVKSVAV